MLEANLVMYHIDVAVDVDASLDPPWVTIRVVEGGAHRGGMTELKQDFISPYRVDLVVDLLTLVEGKLLKYLAGIDGIQLEL